MQERKLSRLYRYERRASIGTTLENIFSLLVADPNKKVDTDQGEAEEE